MRLAAMQLSVDPGKVEVLVVTEENRLIVTEQLEAWQDWNPGIFQERLERVLFVSPLPIELPRPAKVCLVHLSQSVF